MTALQAAHEYWENNKFDIIAQKVRVSVYVAARLTNHRCSTLVFRTNGRRNQLKRNGSNYTPDSVNTNISTSTQVAYYSIDERQEQTTIS